MKRLARYLPGYATRRGATCVRRASGGSLVILTAMGKGLNASGQPSGPPGSLSHNAGAWAKFGRPEKRLRFSRAAEFGRARMAEPGPQGPQRFLR